MRKLPDSGASLGLGLLCPCTQSGPGGLRNHQKDWPFAIGGDTGSDSPRRVVPSPTASRISSPYWEDTDRREVGTDLLTDVGNRSPPQSSEGSRVILWRSWFLESGPLDSRAWGAPSSSPPRPHGSLPPTIHSGSSALTPPSYLPPHSTPLIPRSSTSVSKAGTVHASHESVPSSPFPPPGLLLASGPVSLLPVPAVPRGLI